MTDAKALMERFNALEQSTRQFILIATASILFLAMAYSAMQGYISRLEKKRISREQTLKEVMVLKQRYLETTAHSARLSNKMASVTPGDTPLTVIEQTGIPPKGSLQSKPLPRQEQGQMSEESAEVTISGLSSNELVNLINRLENGQKPVAIRKGIIRSRFNDPSKLDLILQVGLFRSSAQPQEKR